MAVAPLILVIKKILGHSLAENHLHGVDTLIHGTHLNIRLSNDESLVPSVISRLEHAVCEIDFCDEMLWMQIAMALDEAIVNAMFHGNLEVSSALRQTDDGKPFFDMIQSRKKMSPYQDRHVEIQMRVDRQQAEFIITDEGPGFDIFSLPDPRDPSNLEKASGRGLLLIHSFMDKVTHNERGNQITMIKRKPDDRASLSDDADKTH